MTTRTSLAGWARITSCGLALAAGACWAHGDQVIDDFNASDSASPWTATWGTNPEISYSTEDAGGSGASGSLRVSADYFTPADDGWEQSVITRSFASPVVGAQFVSISIDVKVDSSSVPASDGQYGYFELKRPDGTSLGGANLTNTSWTTLSFPLPATEGSLGGVIIQNGNGGFQGPVIFYLDNLKFNEKPAAKTVVATFDDEFAADGWAATWGSAAMVSWSTENAGGGTSSGSLMVAADYFTPRGRWVGADGDRQDVRYAGGRRRSRVGVGGHQGRSQLHAHLGRPVRLF